MENCFGLMPVKPRERIISTARELFRKCGLRGSKDELVCECLRDVARDVEQMWSEVEAAHPGNPLAQLHAWIRVGAECANSNDGRGCDMANAAVELAETDHPARQVIEEFKRKQRDRLAQLAHEAGITESELLADTLVLLLEGARVSRQSVGAAGPCAHFITSAEAVIASFLHKSGGGKSARSPKRVAEAAKAF
jgi:AcrR family transcriptional regulator